MPNICKNCGETYSKHLNDQCPNKKGRFYTTTPVDLEIELLDSYVVEAQRLTDIVDASGRGYLTHGEARNAFILLRKIAKREPV